jgi:hypothetical protein
MTSLTYLALDDDDLQDAARHLPLDRVQLKHLVVYPIKQAAMHDIVVLHRPDGRAVLKNTFEPSEVES